MSDVFTWILIGAGIGFILEAGGLGNPRKLTGVFTLRDWTVLQVMPTAIVASMACVLVLGLFGTDTTQFFVPRTQYVGQLVGGALFGVGFFLGGYCPGTSVVGLASGRVDAAPFIAGMLGGWYAWDAWRASLMRIIERAPASLDTLPEIVGLDHRVLAAIFVVAGGGVIVWLWSRSRRAGAVHG